MTLALTQSLEPTRLCGQSVSWFSSAIGSRDAEWAHWQISDSKLMSAMGLSRTQWIQHDNRCSFWCWIIFLLG